jgi:hypothetical protein
MARKKVDPPTPTAMADRAAVEETPKQIDIRLDPWDGGVSVVLSTNGELLQSVALANAAARRLAWALLQTTEV